MTIFKMKLCPVLQLLLMIESFISFLTKTKLQGKNYEMISHVWVSINQEKCWLKNNQL